ncbi:MAG: hypothetical protein ACU0CI_04070, partial [Shimia sp.]
MATASDTALLPPAERDRLKKTVQALHAAQGCALNAAAILIEVATAPTPEQRSETAKQFIVFRDRYKTLSEPILTSTTLQRDGGEKPLRIVKGIVDRFAHLKEDDAFATLSTTHCGEVVNYVRLQGVPALMELIGTVRTRQKAHEKAMRALTKARIAQLDTMFTEVEEIGQM